MEKPPYRLQVNIRQDQWAGRVGVFVGGHKDRLNGLPCLRAQLIELEQHPPSDGRGPPTFYVHRVLLIAQKRTDGFFSFSKEEDRTARVAAPQSEQVLEIFVGKPGLIALRWGGQDLAELTKDGTNLLFSSADYLGDFGFYNDGSAAVFRNAQQMLFEDETHGDN
jgi:hypothetical protein